MDFLAHSPEPTEPLLGRWELETLAMRPVVLDDALSALERTFSFVKRDRFVARLCLDESITNACEHSELEKSGPVVVSLYADSQGWVLRVRDQGRGFVAEEIDDGIDGDVLSERGRGLAILDGYAERMVVAEEGREVTVWLRVSQEESTR